MEDTTQTEDVQRITVHPGQQTDNWAKIQEALSEGYSADEVSSYMQKTMGIDAQTARTELNNSVQAKINTAIDEGYSYKEVKDYLFSNNYDNNLVKDNIIQVGRNKAIESFKKYEWDPKTSQEDAKDLKSLYANMYGKYSTLGKQLHGFFDDGAAAQARKDIDELNLGIVNKLKENNINALIHPETGEVAIQNEDGSLQEVDDSLINDIFNAKGEIGGAIMGGISGAAMGAPLGPAGMIAGGVLGSAGGASLGKLGDLIVNSHTLKEKLTANLAVSQVAEAGIFDAAATVLGVGVVKGGSSVIKTVKGAYNFVLQGNSNGAVKYLKEAINLSDEKAIELVDKLENILQDKMQVKKIFGDSREMTQQEKQITAILSTQKGTEQIVRHAVQDDLKLANTIVRTVDDRAKNINKLINSTYDANTGKLVRDDLNKYEKEVKNFYSTVKGIASDAIDGTDFRFDFDKLAIDPVMESVAKSISDPTVQDKFILHTTKIKNASKDRTFSGLIELRQAVNDFKYSKTISSKPDLDAINGVINNIDGQIAKAAKQYMPDTHKEWLNQWTKAKSEYSRMKKLEENAMYKNIVSNAKNENLIQKSLNKYSNDLDVDIEVYDEVVKRLSPAVRNKTELAAIKNLTNKYTLGKETDFQAIDFPELANALKELNLQGQESKYVASVITEMADIFKNDVHLSNLSGGINLPQMQAALTDNLVAKAKWAFVGEVWNTLKTLLPTKTAHNLALIRQTKRLLEEPLNYKTMENVIKNVPVEKRNEVRSLIKEMQVQMAKQPVKQKDTINLYKQSLSDKLKKSKGAWGEGVYLYEKVKPSSSDAKVVKQTVNVKDLATLDDISSLVGRDINPKDLRNMPEVAKQLKEKGFKGIKIDDKAMLFDNK